MNTTRMRDASYLLPEPGGEVVRQCLDEIDRLTNLLTSVHTAEQIAETIKPIFRAAIPTNRVAEIDTADLVPNIRRELINISTTGALEVHIPKEAPNVR